MPDIDEDVMRELMIHSTADLFARPAATAEALRRQRQHRLRTRVLERHGDRRRGRARRRHPRDRVRPAPPPLPAGRPGRGTRPCSSPPRSRRCTG